MRTTQTILETVLERQADGKGLQRGLVLAVDPAGFVTVVMDQKEITCDVLQAAAQPLTLARGDSVLVWLPVGDDRGVILGRIGSSQVPISQEKEPPAELVLEARKNLTLKCGDGSITLRGDGKILIKGKDLVSHALRNNRIKGGSVAIN